MSSPIVPLQMYFTHGERFIKGLLPLRGKVSSVTCFGADSLAFKEKTLPALPPLSILQMSLSSVSHLSCCYSNTCSHWKSNIANLEFNVYKSHCL